MHNQTKISLDTNILIFGIRNIDPYSVAILKNLYKFNISISAQIEKEIRNNISLSELNEFYQLLNPLANFEIVYEQPDPAIVELYQNMGLKKGDALIAAFCYSTDISIFLSENRHFLQQLQKQSFEIMDSESFCLRYELY
jgi:predicted nucleic acid-binding protein